MIINGKNLGLFARMDDGLYDTFGLSTSCSLSISTDTIEMASLNSLAKSYIAGRYSYTLQSDRLYDGGDMMRRLLTYMVTRKPLAFRFSEGAAVGGEMVEQRGSGGMTLSGEAYITGYNINAPVEGYANVSISLQGTGPLTIEQDGHTYDLGDAASLETGIVDLEDADSKTTGIINLGQA
jgi:predicted secreted protein